MAISRLVVLSAVVGINNLAVTLLCNSIKNKLNFQLLRKKKKRDLFTVPK